MSPQSIMAAVPAVEATSMSQFGAVRFAPEFTSSDWELVKLNRRMQVFFAGVDDVALDASAEEVALTGMAENPTSLMNWEFTHPEAVPISLPELLTEKAAVGLLPWGLVI